MSWKLWDQRLRLLVVAGVLAPAAMVLVGFFLALLVRGETLHLLRWPGWRALGLGAVTSAVSMGLVYGLYKSNKSFERALKESGVKVGEEALKMAGYPVMFVVVTAAGIGEEVLFRGGLQPSIGIVAAALLFGFSHGGWRREMWAYAVAASVSGALFGYAYHVTGDLWVPVIAHTLHNALATVLLGQNTEEADKANEITQEGPVGGVEVSDAIPDETDSQTGGPEDWPIPPRNSE